MKKNLLFLAIPMVLLSGAIATEKQAEAAEPLRMPENVSINKSGRIGVKNVSFTANTVTNLYSENTSDLLIPGLDSFSDKKGTMVKLYTVDDPTDKLKESQNLISEREVPISDTFLEINKKLEQKQKEEKEAKEKKAREEREAKEEAERKKREEEAKKAEEQAKKAEEQAKKEAEEKARQAEEDEKAGRFTSEPAASGFAMPLKSGYTLTSGFGPRWSEHHDGLDMATGEGTEIYASRAGTIVAAGFDPSAGNHIIIQHDNGYYTYYMHMTHFNASNGQFVNAGDLIGFVGSTGNSTGPHLHFGVSTALWSGFQDPEYILGL